MWHYPVASGVKMQHYCIMKNIRHSVTLTKHQDEALTKEAEKLGVSMSRMIGRVIDEWLGGGVKNQVVYKYGDCEVRYPTTCLERNYGEGMYDSECRTKEAG